MVVQTEFPNPPEGHVGLLVYDIVTKKWYALLGDASGHLQIDVLAVALPSGAATAAKQLGDGHNVTVDNPSIAVTGAFYPGTQPVSGAFYPGTQPVSGTFYLATQPISAAALPLPTGAAIESKQLGDGHNVTVDNTYIDVRSGNDKIFSMESVVADAKQMQVTANTNSLDSTVVPASKIWVITSAQAVYVGTTPGNMLLQFVHGGTVVTLTRSAGVVNPVPLTWQGHAYMDVDDLIRIYVEGCTADDYLYLEICGFQMDAPS